MNRLLNYFIKIFKAIAVEAFLIFILIFIINNYLENEKETIKADGIGYYEYLPSLFIHHDLVRKGIPNGPNSSLYQRINKLPEYVKYKDFKVDICSCGTAILELPFFTWTYLTTTRDGSDDDGYQPPFQIAIFHAAIFYLFLSIFFLKKTLELFDIRKYAVIISQLLLVLATSVTSYANFDASFSHVYSLFAITAFIYVSRLYFKYRNINNIFFAFLLLGLILVLRQVNILIIFFLPFIAGSWENFKNGILHLVKNVN